MKLLIGMPVKSRAWILPEWFQAVESQGIELEIVCIYSASEDNTEQILKEHNVEIVYDARPGRKISDIDNHNWGLHSNYDYMASMRNQLIDIALSKETDYFFSLDSDILLPAGGLGRLLNYSIDHPGVVAPAVNMTVGTMAMNTMQWTASGFAGRLMREPPGGKADVVMAAMLLDRLGMQARWKQHPQGEDVGFCADAEAKQILRWWVPEIKCEHAMRHY